MIAPPYDVIDDELRAQLAARSPYNVVEIDLPHAATAGRARDDLDDWRERGRARREDEPAIWALRQDYTAPGRQPALAAPASSRACAWRTTAPGRIRPHERTHPGPKEDRLRLTRATRANLSPIFSLFPDPDGAAAEALGQAIDGEPFADGDRPRGHAQHALARRPTRT